MNKSKSKFVLESCLLETLSLKKEERQGDKAEISFNFEISRWDKEVSSGVPVLCRLKFKLTNVDYQIELSLIMAAEVLDRGGTYEEYANDPEVRNKLMTPLLSKATQIIANITAEFLPFPFIIRIPDDLLNNPTDSLSIDS